jgi:NADH:ubiquinone oxidoreductase subunit F (NADH-binding)
MLGEETVLLKALEGKRGQPEQRPPYPAEVGLFNRPTVVQNVQTLAAVPWILVNGPEAFAAIGSKASPGTILVQVRGAGGDGIAEVPLGTPLRDILELAGGAKKLKAVLVGGWATAAASCSTRR